MTAAIELTAAMAIVATGAFVQSSIGFGMAIVAAPILFLLDPAYVPAPMIIATLTNAIYTAWRYRASLTLRALSAAIIARVPGSIAGALLLLAVSARLLAVIIALVIVTGIVLTYMRFSVAFTTRNLAIAGFLSGLMGTSTSIGGPPIALMMQGQAANAIRGNLCAFFIFSSVMSLIVLAPTPRFDLPELSLGLALVPAAAFGSWAGVRYGSRLSDRLLRHATLVLCAIAVLAMLGQYLFAVPNAL